MIFSKNRPMQLHGLIESIKRLTNIKDISVLYSYDDKYKAGLEKVKFLHPEINFIEQISFENHVKEYLKLGQKFCVFFVDDMICKLQLDVNIPCSLLANNPNILTYSMRLGTHLTHCYPVNRPQRVPNGAVNSGFFIWQWKNSEYDWNYPFSVDGHIFRRSELEGWSSHLTFSNPNQFESQLQTISNSFALPDLCISSLNSSVFNIPMNKVQNEFNNRSENISIDELYDLWMSGFVFDSEKIVGFLNDGAHSPVTLPIRKIEQ